MNDVPRERNRVLVAHNARVAVSAFIDHLIKAGVFCGMNDEHLLELFFQYMVSRGFTILQAERAGREIAVRAPSSAAELTLVRSHS